MIEKTYFLLFLEKCWLTFLRKRNTPLLAGKEDTPQNVGLSNILDSELGGRHPAERPHGQVVGAAVVDGKLLCKVVERKERAARVEAFLILAVAALDLAVVARRVRTDQFMPDIQFGGRFFK